MTVNASRKLMSALGLAGVLAISGCAPIYGPGWEKDYPPVAYSRDLYPGYGSVQAIDLIRHENNSGMSEAPKSTVLDLICLMPAPEPTDW